jgi:LysM repeat protein
MTGQNQVHEAGSAGRQFLLGVAAALVSILVVSGSLALALSEGSQPRTLNFTFTPTVSVEPIIIILDTPKPGEPTATLTVVPSETPICPVPAGWVAHQVKSDETLESLAQASGISADALKQGNCLLISRLLSGMVIYLPPTPADTDTPEPAEPTETLPPRSTCGPPVGWQPYRIQRGDTLYALAVASGSTVLQLMDNNCLTSSNIQAGQIIFLPFAPPTKTLTPTVTLTPPPTQPLQARLTLEMTALTAGYDSPGDTLNYSYTLRNTGTATLSGPFSVTDSRASVSCSPSAQLAVGASLSCTGSYSVTQADIDAGSLTNTATAQAVYSGSAVNSNSVSQTVNASRNPGLSLNVDTSSGSYASPGDSLDYTYQLSNTGNVTLSGPFTVSDNPAGAADCSSAPASLAPGGSFSCSGSYAVTQADIDAGSVTNSATAQAVFNGSPVNSNADGVTIYANQNPVLGLTILATPNTFTAAGQSIAYTFTLQNNGNVTLQSPSVTAPLSISCPGGGLAPGASTNCSANYTTTDADVTNTSFEITAQASANYSGGSTSSSNVQITINLE